MMLHELFQVLSNETRLKILALLAKGEFCVCQIYASIGTSQPNISQHLNLLKSLGIVESRRDGTFILYSINKQILKQYPFLNDLLRIAQEEYKIDIRQSCSAI